MRALTITVPILLASSLAAAHTHAGIDMTKVPEACRKLDVVPSSATTNRPELAAETSIASCAATERLRALVLTDDLSSVRSLDEATAPSLAMYDDVISRGDLEQQIVALHAKADLLLGLQARMRDSISKTCTFDEAARHRTNLEPMLAGWRTTATAALDRIATLATSDPRLVRHDPVVAYVVTQTKIERPVTAATP